ncbi:auxilin-related protein 1 [Phtheirospermum japonicum]|uniref:Auxilin-related protein 1 n=1 Tax=Phtheirospermum japonicum TaxID=374723 RepID=A0A830CUE5_9LAMI|nr:auxilin-related protein 1 [Phtheirospermum japonicum]
MEDLDTLARDFGFGPRGKSNPMRSAQPDHRPIDDRSFSDVFGGPAKYTPSSNSINNDKPTDLDYDSIFNSSAKKTNNSSSKASSIPVYDKPVYDEDMASSTVRFDNDDFDGLLGNFGRNEKREKENVRSNSAKSSSRGKGFDDLLAGFGSGISADSNSGKLIDLKHGDDDIARHVE